jgi:hypothetical protein
MGQYEERYQLALKIAIYYQNLCCDLEEIVEMFCLDADENHSLEPWVTVNAHHAEEYVRSQDVNVPTLKAHQMSIYWMRLGFV